MTPRARIAAALRSANRILLVNHVDPDGDTLGSTLALALALESLGKHVTVGSDGGVPATFTFLPGAGRVLREPPPGAAFDVALTMECSTLQRCGRFAPLVTQTPLIAAIDHHESHTVYAHLDDWDPEAAAAGEMTMDLIRHLGASITPPVATALLTALATDTGVFRFPTVRPETLRLGAALMEAGGDLVGIVSAVFDQRSLASTRMLGYALLRTVVTSEGAVAYTTLTESLRRAAGAQPEESAGIVGALRGLAGVRVAVLFEEAPEGIRVSIRARDGVRANIIAEALGGGGHPAAAGCTVLEPMDEAVRRVLEAIERELARWRGQFGRAAQPTPAPAQTTPP
jgi:phosphoesterase RecJ-like protein